MDNDKKVTAPADNISYDPDAAELLKDLEDDDDEDEIYAPADAGKQNSLVNILTSSANLESLTSSTAMPASEAPSDDSDTERLEVSDNEEDEDARKTEVNLPPVSDAAAPSAPKDAGCDNSECSASNKTDAKLPLIGGGNSIRPFEVKHVSVKTPDNDALADADLDAELRNSASRSVSGNSKLPPVPPRPSGNVPAVPARNLSANDSAPAPSSDAIADLIAGGKNDEARDLAAIKYNDNNWYAQIFNEDFFRTTPKNAARQTLREAKFIMERLGIQSGARVLDLCCGCGRHTIELAKQGFDMIGLDLSMVMLKKALADAQAAGLAIKFVHGDMRKLNFKAIFDAIYCVQTSFGYFDELSNFRVLQGIYRALKPGGVFLIETVNRDFVIDDLPLRLWWKGTECMLLEEIDMDPLSGVIKVGRSFVFDGNTRQPWEQKIQIRLYSVTEMRSLLMRAGFNVVDLSGDYSLPGAYFGAESPRIILVAEKPIK